MRARDERGGPLDVAAWFEERVRSTGFLRDYPRYAGLLASLEVVELDAGDPVPYMAVSLTADGVLLLHVRRAPFESEPAAFRGVLCHELAHVSLGHLVDPRIREAEDPDLMALACEVSANEVVGEYLPGRPVLLEDFRALGMEAGQSTLERYRLLVEPPRAALRERPQRCCRGGGSGGRSARGSTSAERLAVEGSAPRGRVDWSLVLRGSRAGRERRATFRRPSRRDPERRRVGVLPRWSWRPVRPRVLAAIDTSESMKPPSFRRVGAELRRLGALADLHVVECDDRVRRDYPWAGRLPEIHGRRGTDVRPVFAPGLLGRLRPDLVVYFTDGRIRVAPEPPSVRVVWALLGDHGIRCAWGERVQVPL